MKLTLSDKPKSSHTSKKPSEKKQPIVENRPVVEKKPVVSGVHKPLWSNQPSKKGDYVEPTKSSSWQTHINPYPQQQHKNNVSCYVNY